MTLLRGSVLIPLPVPVHRPPPPPPTSPTDSHDRLVYVLVRSHPRTRPPSSKCMQAFACSMCGHGHFTRAHTHAHGFRLNMLWVGAYAPRAQSIKGERRAVKLPSAQQRNQIVFARRFERTRDHSDNYILCIYAFVCVCVYVSECACFLWTRVHC